jgi:hypothetical protein
MYSFCRSSGRVVKCEGLWLLACWNWGFESLRRQWCLSLVGVVCCTVESSATGPSLVRRSPSECGECNSVWSRTQILMRLWPARAVEQRRTVFIFELPLWCLNFCFVIGGFQILISDWSPDITCYCCSCLRGCRMVLVSAAVVWWRPLRYRSFEVVHHNYLALRSIYFFVVLRCVVENWTWTDWPWVRHYNSSKLSRSVRPRMEYFCGRPVRPFQDTT